MKQGSMLLTVSFRVTFGTPSFARAQWLWLSAPYNLHQYRECMIYHHHTLYIKVIKLN